MKLNDNDRSTKLSQKERRNENRRTINAVSIPLHLLLLFIKAEVKYLIIIKSLQWQKSKDFIDVSMVGYHQRNTGTAETL